MYFPKITIIVAVFNGAGTLSRCLKSIHSQSGLNKELIVMDGGSRDRSKEIIQAHSRHIAYWESAPDRGIYHAWNKALSHASGEWVCFLGSDDFFWQDDVLERLAPFLEAARKKDIRLVYGRVASVNKTGEIKSFLGAPWEREESLFSHRMPPHPGLLHHADIFKDYGGFDETFRIAADYELLLKELMVRDAMFVPDIVVAGIQNGGISCDIRHFFRLIREDVTARKKCGLSLITVPVLKYYVKLFFNSVFY